MCVNDLFLIGHCLSYDILYLHIYLKKNQVKLFNFHNLAYGLLKEGHTYIHEKTNICKMNY